MSSGVKKSVGLADTGIMMLVFAILGPPIGALVLSVLLPLFILVTWLAGNANPVAGRMSAVVAMLPPALLGSYAAGLLSATATGALFVAQRFYFRHASFMWVALPATVVWLCYLLIGPTPDAFEAILLWPVHVVPAIVCGWIAMRLTRQAT